MKLPSSSQKQRPAALVDVSAGVIVLDNKILIAQRLPGVHLAGLWEFPGGKRDLGEPWKASLRRELTEELGLTVEVGPFLQSVTHHYPEKSVRIRFYCCYARTSEAMPLACQRIAWVTLKELRRFKFPAADRKFLEDLQAGRFNHFLRKSIRSATNH